MISFKLPIKQFTFPTEILFFREGLHLIPDKLTSSAVQETPSVSERSVYIHYISRSNIITSIHFILKHGNDRADRSSQTAGPRLLNEDIPL